MNHINEFSDQFTGVLRKSYDQVSGFSTKVGEEAGRVIEGQFGQTRELMELGLKTQTTLFGEWMKNAATARDMWTETVQSFSKAIDTTPAKTSKANS